MVFCVCCLGPYPSLGRLWRSRTKGQPKKAKERRHGLRMSRPGWEISVLMCLLARSQGSKGKKGQTPDSAAALWQEPLYCCTMLHDSALQQKNRMPPHPGPVGRKERRKRMKKAKWCQANVVWHCSRIVSLVPKKLAAWLESGAVKSRAFLQATCSSSIPGAEEDTNVLFVLPMELQGKPRWFLKAFKVKLHVTSNYITL